MNCCPHFTEEDTGTQGDIIRPAVARPRSEQYGGVGGAIVPRSKMEECQKQGTPKSQDRELFMPPGELREEFEEEVLWRLKDGAGLSGGEGEWFNGPRRILPASLHTDDSVSSL